MLQLPIEAWIITIHMSLEVFGSVSVSVLSLTPIFSITLGWAATLVTRLVFRVAARHGRARCPPLRCRDPSTAAATRASVRNAVAADV